jgi:hypothetical protein
LIIYELLKETIGRFKEMAATNIGSNGKGKPFKTVYKPIKVKK